jgi:hypothetical protein
MDVPCEWDDIIGSARHNPSPFKVINPLEQGNVFGDMKASLGLHLFANLKPRLLIKPLRTDLVKDTESCVISSRTP